jgi:hypothetical protein
VNPKMKLFSYSIADTPIHRLSDLTKLICFLLLTFAVMYSYDIRVILSVMVFFHSAHAHVPDPLFADPVDGHLYSDLPGDQCHCQLSSLRLNMA